MKKVIKRYAIVIIAVVILAVSMIWDLTIAGRATSLAATSLRQLVLVLPPIFVLMGLLDVWVPRETLIKYMGVNSRVLGAAIAFFLGSAAAGPLYIAFPIAAMLLKKGASFTNVLIFIGAWSTTKIPLLMFEYSSMGSVFTLTRLLVNIPVIILIAVSLNLALGKEEQQSVRASAETMLE